jgi:hypothetical protein
MRRLATLALVAALAVPWVMPGTASANHSEYPTSKSGTSDCSGVGSIALETRYATGDGLRASTHPIGTPVGGWSRTKQPYGGTFPFSFISLVSKNNVANWALTSYVTDPSYGLNGPHAACTLKAVSGTVIATRSGPAKTCPTGQTVLIVSSGYTPQGHFWTRVGSSTMYRTKQTGTSLLWFFLTDTGSNRIGQWTIRAYAGSANPENPLPGASVTCSAAEGISGTVAYP